MPNELRSIRTYVLMHQYLSMFILETMLHIMDVDTFYLNRKNERRNRGRTLGTFETDSCKMSFTFPIGTWLYLAVRRFPCNSSLTRV